MTYNVNYKIGDRIHFSDGSIGKITGIKGKGYKKMYYCEFDGMRYAQGYYFCHNTILCQDPVDILKEML